MGHAKAHARQRGVQPHHAAENRGSTSRAAGSDRPQGALQFRQVDPRRWASLAATNCSGHGGTISRVFSRELVLWVLRIKIGVAVAVVEFHVEIRVFLHELRPLPRSSGNS